MNTIIIITIIVTITIIIIIIYIYILKIFFGLKSKNHVFQISTRNFP